METFSATTRPFVAKALYYEDADALEYVRIDAPVVYRRIDEFLTLILDIENRSTVGFKIKGFRNFYIRKVKPTISHDDMRFLRLVTILEKLMTELGDGIFVESSRHEAYTAAANIAMTDQVLVSDLPRAV